MPIQVAGAQAGRRVGLPATRTLARTAITRGTPHCHGEEETVTNQIDELGLIHIDVVISLLAVWTGKTKTRSIDSSLSLLEASAKAFKLPVNLTEGATAMPTGE